MNRRGFIKGATAAVVAPVVEPVSTAASVVMKASQPGVNHQAFIDMLLRDCVASAGIPERVFRMIDERMPKRYVHLSQPRMTIDE